MFDSRKRREVLKTNFKELSFVVSDQNKNIKQPPIEKEIYADYPLVNLPDPEKVTLIQPDIFTVIKSRISRRKFTEEPISLEDLSYLLWATQGVKKIFDRSPDYKVTMRTVPSAGARHPFETYLAVNNVDELKKGIYYYVPTRHKLILIKETENLKQKLTKAALGQNFVGENSVVFIWSAVPYRTEWRYDFESAKLILLDAGHVCQNLYLACESLKLGTCAIGAFDTELFNELIDLDSEDEFVIYLSPVGKY